jgi:hypothetical protein
MVSVRVCPYQLADRCRHPRRRDCAVVEHPGILPLAVCAMRGRRDGRGDRGQPICNGMSHMRHADVKMGGIRNAVSGGRFAMGCPICDMRM